MNTSRRRQMRTQLGIAAMLGLLSLSPSRAATPATPLERSFEAMVQKASLALPTRPDSEMLQKAGQAIGLLKRVELEEAGRAINEALQLDARNSYLHFLNGFIYHLQARQGDAQKNELAVEGYQQALRLDPANWIAQEFLGLAFLEQKRFNQARDHFAEALLLSPDSVPSMHGLMVSAYLTGDAEAACAMADQIRQTPAPATPAFLRSSVSVYAACAEFGKAEQMRALMVDTKRDPGEIERVDRRLAQWKVVHRTPAAENPRVAAAFNVAPQDEAPPAAPPAPAPALGPTSPRPDPNDGTPRMVLVDVVMVATEELVSTSKGINLLNALSLQFGSSSAPAFSRSFNSSTGMGNVITRAITVPALSYSLNIANATNGQNEVLARPTLAAMEGVPSEFFSGTNLNAAVVSTNSLGSPSAVPIDKRFGVKLGITPSFLPNGMVKLKVDALRTFLNANVDNAGFAYRLEISETSANANVVMNLGDTLVLSGLSEKEASASRSGVPLLQDVPGVQYLFARKTNLDFQRSVLILITPRQPVYTSKLDHAAAGGTSDSMRALRERMGFSGRTPANVESILNHLKTTRLFREFRQGDVSLEQWDRLHSTGERLKQALEFLYY
ncbi:secretion protein [Piscinibacter gummiphilus]|uniref:Secretion protein n=1 Tax=Piscinibacter gummiphilus TaxID=946333 RepID=A0ABZ0D2P1_9BURK|nr:secretion protein [Piscinibacter gummiphilus]WOB08999.1 secretion protein [Piscinibacter gummiphilus]